MKNPFEDRAIELYEEAKDLVIANRKGSTPFLQRKLKIGYGVAYELINLLEKNGVLGKANGAKPRDVLLTPSKDNK